MRNSHRIALVAAALGGLGLFSLAVCAELAGLGVAPATWHGAGRRGGEASDPRFAEVASASAAARLALSGGHSKGVTDGKSATGGRRSGHAGASSERAFRRDTDPRDFAESDSEGQRPPDEPSARGRELRLDRPGIAAASVRFRGSDAGAPRGLLLWRLRGERAAVMARGESREDGSFEFPPLRVPAAGLTVVATPAYARPDHPEASPAQTLPPRLPEAPRGTVLSLSTDSTHSTAGDEIRLRVVPAEAAGFVLIATGDGHVFGRFALSAHPDAAQRNLDLSVSLPRWEDAGMLQVAHERPSGLRSQWRTLDWNSVLETHGGIFHANE